MLGEVLDVDAVLDEATALPHLVVLLAVPLGEAPLLGDVDLEDDNIKFSNTRQTKYN